MVRCRAASLTYSILPPEHPTALQCQLQHVSIPVAVSGCCLLLSPLFLALGSCMVRAEQTPAAWPFVCFAVGAEITPYSSSFATWVFMTRA